MNNNNKNYEVLLFIWFKLALNDDSQKSYKIYTHFESIVKLYEATKEEYELLPEINEKHLTALINKDLTNANKIYDFCINNDIQVLCIESEDYPQGFLNIKISPCLLFILGDYKSAFSKPIVAIVGTRKCTEYGMRITNMFSGELALNGCTIATGVADGIDNAASKAALKANGSVISFLPDGVFHKYLGIFNSQSSYKNKVYITEHLPNYPQTRFAYHERNRLIPAISQCCLVTQAPESSGAIITANYALEQSIPVFAVPANIDIPQSAGTNKLLYDGAFPVLSYTDILDHLGLPYDKSAKNLINDLNQSLESDLNDVAFKIENFKKRIYSRLDSEEASVLTLFNEQPITFDYLVEKLPNSSYSTLLSIVSKFETMKIIITLAGNLYKLNYNKVD